MKEAALRIDGSQKRRGGIAGVESGGFGILHCPDGGSAIGILSPRRFFRKTVAPPPGSPESIRTSFRAVCIEPIGHSGIGFQSEYCTDALAVHGNPLFSSTAYTTGSL